jgi:hypothetical protein
LADKPDSTTRGTLVIIKTFPLSVGVDATAALGVGFAVFG